MRRFKFNMVEIALAVAVISIGLSAVLVLFPVGINATRAAMDENSYSDAAEYVTRYIRGQFLGVWRSTPTQSSFSTPPGFFDTEYKEDPSEDGLKWKSSGETNFDKLYKATNLGAGVYKFVERGYNGEEIFSAVVKVWMPANDLTDPASNASSACPLYIPHTTDPTNPNKPKRVTGTDSAETMSIPNGSGGTVNFGSFAQSVLVEISWPADAPDADRTNRRVFRVDVYNPYYGIAP